MNSNTRVRIVYAGLMAALALFASGPVAVNVAAQSPKPGSVVTLQQMPPSGPTAPQPAVAQVPLPPPPTTHVLDGPPSLRGFGPQSPSLSPIAVSQLEEGRRADSFDQTLSLSFAEPIAVRELLNLLVRDTNVSVVFDPDVEGTFNGELKNVTMRQALDLILQPINLEYSMQESVLRVRKHQTQTRVFNINYVSQRASNNMNGTGMGMGMGYGNNLYGGGVGGGVGGIGGGAGMSGGYGMSAGYAGGMGGYGGIGGYGNNQYGNGYGTNGQNGDVFMEIEKGIAMLLSQDGRVNMDRKAGLLQVTDFAKNLDKVANYLELVESRILRQVHIQAKVIEVEMNEQFSAGIDWTAVLKTATNAITLTQKLAPTSGQSAFTMGVNIKDFSGLLDAFASQGKVNVMASPRVMAMNNEPAVMRVGTQDVFFVTSSQVDTGTGQILQTSVTPQTVTEGITLNVVPQIGDDGIVHLSISPTITERTGVATSRLGDQVPIISVRETDTMVRVHEGETIVIAGLMQERTIGTKTKVPLLGDVPILGALFRRDDRTKKKVDLVILLTPTIVTPGDVAAMSASDQQRLYEAQRAPVRK